MSVMVDEEAILKKLSASSARTPRSSQYELVNVELLSCEMQHNPLTVGDQEESEYLSYSVEVDNISVMSNSFALVFVTCSASKEVGKSTSVLVKAFYVCAVRPNKILTSASSKTMARSLSKHYLWPRFRSLVHAMMIDTDNGLPVLPHEAEHVNISDTKVEFGPFSEPEEAPQVGKTTRTDAIRGG